MGKNKFKKFNGGEMSFGLQIILFLVIIFVVWVLMGGPSKNKEQKPFITPLSDPNNPGSTYGPR